MNSPCPTVSKSSLRSIFQYNSCQPSARAKTSTRAAPAPSPERFVAPLCACLQEINYNALQRMFNGARKFNSDISGWDVTRIKMFAQMFDGCWKFNQSLESWDVSEAHNQAFDRMFHDAREFDGSLATWDVSRHSFFGAMFKGAVQFSGRGLGNWDMKSAKQLNNMFDMRSYRDRRTGPCPDCESAFNEDIGKWNVAKVTSMNGLFRGCTKFNQVSMHAQHGLPFAVSLPHYPLFLSRYPDRLVRPVLPTAPVCTARRSWRLNGPFSPAHRPRQDLSQWDVPHVVDHSYKENTNLNGIGWGVENGGPKLHPPHTAWLQVRPSRAKHDSQCVL